MDLNLLKAELERDEGLRLKPYRDSVGKLTIGIGRNLDDVGISQKEAEFLLDNDLTRTLARLDASLPKWRELDTVRQRVVANMAFNLGVGKLFEFKKMLAALDKKDYAEAAIQMLDSTWATQVGERAQRLAKMMRDGSTQEG